uniref:Myb-like domain-containing protein n=1 Tax=Pundamilia nyererei TaxID=303518 RepID=A0A3B4GRM1_9CICH
MMEEVEKLCDRLELTSTSTNRLLLFPQVQEVNAQLQKEREAEIQARQAARSSEQASGGAGGGKGWNEEDLQLLIKAVNLFPAGTNARWEVIADYMNTHSTSGMKRTAKDVINKAKNLQRLDPVQKDEINRKAFEKFKKEHTSVPPSIDNAVPSERFDEFKLGFTPHTEPPASFYRTLRVSLGSASAGVPCLKTYRQLRWQELCCRCIWCTRPLWCLRRWPVESQRQTWWRIRAKRAFQTLFQVVLKDTGWDVTRFTLRLSQPHTVYHCDSVIVLVLLL